MGIFSALEKRAFAPPQKLSPSQWADRHAYIPPNKPYAGKYHSVTTQYMAGIADAIEETDIKEIVVMKSARIGYSTMLCNLIGWIADQQPSPVLLVYPDEQFGRKIIDEDIRPALNASPQLQPLLKTGQYDEAKDAIRFSGCMVNLGWSGSPTTLGGRSIRFAILDECDKFKPFSGKDADPISLARTRTLDWGHRGKVVLGSTPTTPENHIARAFAECGDKRRYHVPCPHCHKFQPLSFTQLRFDSEQIRAIENKAARAEFIELNRLAYYECQHCQGQIEDHDKPGMVEQGVWLSETQSVVDGVVVGDRPKAKRVGFHISSIYNPLISFSQIAAQFVRSVGDTGAMMEFRNQWLGEPFEEVVATMKVADARIDLATAPESRVIPRWGKVLITTVDVRQEGHEFHFVTRVWGGGNRSQLINCGKLISFDSVYQIGLETVYPIEGTTQTMRPLACLIDAGYISDQIYEFSRRDTRIYPIMGSPTPISPGIKRSTAAKHLGVSLYLIDTGYYKDRLHTLRHDKKWLISKAATDEYFRHLMAEHKVIEKGKAVWQQVTSGAANHYFDCETYQCAAADMCNVSLLPELAEDDLPLPPVEIKSEPRLTETTSSSAWLKTKSNSWL